MALTNFGPKKEPGRKLPMAKARMMVLNRNYTLRSTLGHMLTFKEDEPMMVPGVMVRRAAEIGALPVDDEGPDNVLVEEDKEKEPPAPRDPSLRGEEIYTAIKKVVEENDSDDFTAGGVPKVASIEKVIGYDTTRKEIQDIWKSYCQDRQEENEAQ